MADRRLVAALVLISLAVAAAPRQAVDVSPNTKNGAVVSRASTAGLTIALAGDENAIYAVSLNAGVWKSSKGGAWQRLPNSPGNACSLAQDPANPRHLAVGERNGLAVPIELNRCGVWETWDAGGTWSLVLDPLSLEGCGSQAVPAVAFDRTGTMFAATAAGIASRPRGAKGFVLHRTSGPVTALSISQAMTWARTRDQLFTSSDQGKSWVATDIPRQVGPDQVTFTSRGDVFSLAVTDDLVVMPCILTPGSRDNHNALLAYQPGRKRWWTQILTSGNGTGLGGRRYTVSFMTGVGPQLFYGAGQEVHQLTGQDPNGNLLFDKPVTTNWGGPYDRPPHEMHSDMWAIHVPTSFGSKGRYWAWIACDGGVYEATPELRKDETDASRIFSHKWVTRNDGLHTHHIHTLTTLEMPGGAARLAYPTSDNDAFYFDPAKGWMNESYLGDVNWTDGDVGNPALALMVRRSAGFGMLTAFRQPPPVGGNVHEDQAITLCNDERYDGPTSFHFIQTLEGERNPNPLLDAVRLVDLPLRTYNDQGKLVPVPGPLGQASQSGGPVLIRNKAFAADPDANRSKYRGWTIEADRLPEGSKEFWVSGGHAHPTYFVLATQGGVARLFRREASGSWKALPILFGQEEASLLDGGQYGAAFVNPYDPRQLFVLSTTGVFRSSNGGESYQADPVLTALLTDSRNYPIRSGELTGDPRGVALASRANALATLSAMAFDRHRPGVAVAASPFTGVFLLDRSGRWHSMPSTRLAGVSSVSIANGSVYAATEGNGLWKLSGDPKDWPLATYLDIVEFVVTRPREQLLLPYVCNGGGDRVASGRVHLQSFDKRRALVDDRWLALSEKHREMIAWRTGVDVVQLSYEPTRGSGLAPCGAAFKLRD